MTSPLVTIIVPVYNTEKCLRRCLDSICGQTYPHLEILCVNDGSTDGSAAILEEYAARDKRIRIFTQENAGQSVARNIGLHHATGEWITGVDSDDYLEIDTIETACANISGEVDIISFGVRIVWESVEEDPQIDQIYAPKGNAGAHAMSQQILLSIPWEFCGKLWRRSLLEQEQAYFPQGLRYEDWFFFFAYTPAAKGIYFLNTQKYHYVRREGSIMSQAYAKSPRNMDHLQVLEQLLQLRQKQSHVFDITPVSLDNLMQTYHFLRDFAPDELKEKALSELRRIAEQYGLKAAYAGYLRFLYPQSWWQKIFVQHRQGKSKFGIGPFKPLILQYKDNIKITRLMGIKLSSRTFR